jgi:acyl carrier protein
MEKEQVEIKLTNIFRKVFNNDSLVLKKEMTANDVDNWDSLSHMILISEIENDFAIKFRLKDLNKMRNVNSESYDFHIFQFFNIFPCSYSTVLPDSFKV